ncbi:MAG TPA: PTS ascorbate transporter subunit IIC [Bacillus bacterium]|nr:PTS ascorbate transporter subunit IIC [Bacillus sp. (in: firmicutes)]
MYLLSVPANMGNVFDWSFFWGTFGFLMGVAGPFVMLSVAISAVGLLIFVIVRAVRNKN